MTSLPRQNVDDRADRAAIANITLLHQIGASVCCVGLLVLLALGIGGTWVGNLTTMEPYRPFFIGLTLLFLELAFRNLYLVPRVCALGIPCADRRTAKRQRLTF